MQIKIINIYVIVLSEERVEFLYALEVIVGVIDGNLVYGTRVPFE